MSFRLSSCFASLSADLWGHSLSISLILFYDNDTHLPYAHKDAGYSRRVDSRSGHRSYPPRRIGIRT